MNIYDIAKEAGVSISTVSKYLNNKSIRPELKERIEYVINKYDYVPSAVAQGLVSKSMKIVAVMVVDIQISHYAAAAYAIDKTLSAFGYRVIICNTLGDEKNSIRYIDSLIKINVDGIIFIGSIFNFLNKYEKVLKKIDDLPIICNNGHLDTNNCHSVYVDDKMEMALTMREDEREVLSLAIYVLDDMGYIESEDLFEGLLSAPVTNSGSFHQDITLDYTMIRSLLDKTEKALLNVFPFP